MLTPDVDVYTRNSPDQNTPAVPISDVTPRGDSNNLYPIGDTRMAFIGAGAGSILLASYLSTRGAQVGNMTIIDPRGAYGGKWKDEDVRVGGFNNPEALRFGGHNLALNNRSGDHMIGYLQGIAQGYLGQDPLMCDMVSSISPLTRHNTWLVGSESGHNFETDVVVMAAGTPKPNRIDGTRIQSNLDQFPTQSEGDNFVVERNQRELTDDELEASAAGKTIVIMGLGNSMAAMINQIQRYENSHNVNLSYVIVTDRDARTVYNPGTPFDGKRSLFRVPQDDYLTGYSADLDRDRRSYFRALNEDHIFTSITGVNYDESTHELTIRRDDGVVNAFDSPQVFALLGHSPDVALFRQLGALADNDRNKGERLIRANDGAIYTPGRGYMSNVFAIGSVAATYNNRNSLVIPGIKGQVKSTTLTLGVRSIAESIRSAEVSARASRPLGKRVLDQAGLTF
jgi:hypothetical protein